MKSKKYLLTRTEYQIVPVYQEFCLTEKEMFEMLKEYGDTKEDFEDFGEFLDTEAQSRDCEDFIYTAANCDTPHWDGQLTKTIQPHNEWQEVMSIVWSINNKPVSKYWRGDEEFKKLENDTKDLQVFEPQSIIRNSKINKLIGDD
jgi:hypothetical protein